jgi:hypothetical protein
MDHATMAKSCAANSFGIPRKRAFDACCQSPGASSGIGEYLRRASDLAIAAGVAGEAQIIHRACPYPASIRVIVATGSGWVNLTRPRPSQKIEAITAA